MSVALKLNFIGIGMKYMLRYSVSFQTNLLKMMKNVTKNPLLPPKKQKLQNRLETDLFHTVGCPETKFQTTNASQLTHFSFPIEFA